MKLNGLIICFVINLGYCWRHGQNTPVPCIDLDICILVTGYMVASTIVCPDGTRLNDTEIQRGRKCNYPIIPTTPSTTTLSKRNILKKIHEHSLESIYRKLDKHQSGKIEEAAINTMDNVGDHVGLANGKVSKNSGMSELLNKFVPNMQFLSLNGKGKKKNRYPRNAKYSDSQLEENPGHTYQGDDDTKATNENIENFKIHLNYRSSITSKKKLRLIQMQKLESFFRKLDKDQKEKIIEDVARIAITADFQGGKVTGKVPKSKGIGGQIEHFVPGLGFLFKYTRKNRNDDVRDSGVTEEYKTIKIKHYKGNFKEEQHIKEV